MKIYTKTGDKGDTRLFDGTQVRKNDPRVAAYGNVDELNSFIGAAGSFLQDNELKGILADIQRDLFSVGAQLADPKQHGKKQKSKLDASRVTALEEIIDVVDRRRGERDRPQLRAANSTIGKDARQYWKCGDRHRNTDDAAAVGPQRAALRRR